MVLMAGRVEDPRKGYAFFRDSVHLLKERGSRFSATVTDPRYDGNSPYIASLGWVPYREMPTLYGVARLVVAPTLWPEPFGLVALEAMACGTPVVASSIGGFKSLVIDGETGFLVPPGNTSVLADRIELLLHDEDLWRMMSEAARQHAMEFSWAKIVSEHYLPLFEMSDP
jgi:glycosyltransferase involved in cell wall biosynthesis